MVEAGALATAFGMADISGSYIGCLFDMAGGLRPQKHSSRGRHLLSTNLGCVFRPACASRIGIVFKFDATRDAPRVRFVNSTPGFAVRPFDSSSSHMLRER